MIALEAGSLREGDRFTSEGEQPLTFTVVDTVTATDWRPMGLTEPHVNIPVTSTVEVGYVFSVVLPTTHVLQVER